MFAIRDDKVGPVVGALAKGDVVERRKRVDKLKQKGLEDQSVVVLRVGAMVLPLGELDSQSRVAERRDGEGEGAQTTRRRTVD